MIMKDYSVKLFEKLNFEVSKKMKLFVFWSLFFDLPIEFYNFLL